MQHSLPSNYNVLHFLEGVQSHILFLLFKLEKFLMKGEEEQCMWGQTRCVKVGAVRNKHIVYLSHTLLQQSDSVNNNLLLNKNTSKSTVFSSELPQFQLKSPNVTKYIHFYLSGQLENKDPEKWNHFLKVFQENKL